MRTVHLRWRLFSTYLLLAAILLVVCAWISASALRRVYLAGVTDHLQLCAQLAAEDLETSLAAARYDQTEKLCRDLGARLTVRLTVVLPSGQVVADSHELPARMSNHGVREEIIGALAGNTTAAQHFSFTLRQDMLYLALPLWHEGQLIAVVRSAELLSAFYGHLLQLYWQLAFGFGFSLLAAAALAYWLSTRIGSPWETVMLGVERFTRGDLTAKIPVTPGTQELAENLNRMAAEMDQRLKTVLRQQREQEAVLAAMVEGVLVMDTQERLLNLNQAAEELLGINASQAVGRLLPEAIRNSRLLDLAAQTLSTLAPVEGDIVLAGDPEKHLQIHGSQLRDAKGRGIGAVLVLHDVTRLRSLENMRKEFVANVSHELKTPITLIQGFLETLLDGSAHKPEDSVRFMRIMSTQAERLNRIIEDLLNLSRLEQETEHGQIELSSQPLRPVLQSAQTICQVQAQAKHVTCEVDCPESLAVRINPRLLEQAVVNLIDNAIKYSSDGGRVEISARAENHEIVIAVRDHGVGIEAEHLPRLFERFYRVDKGRSRELGGTGLGLAIVKHILQTHGGRTAVESVPGQGSTFSLYLPQS